YPNIDQEGPFLTVQNIKFYHILTLMGEIADELHYESDALRFAEQARKLKINIFHYLYDEKQKRFIDCFQSKESHQGTNVLAFQYGLVPSIDREMVLKWIVSQGMDCKTLLSLNLFQVLFENGYEQTAYEWLNRTEYPGWGYMIEKGDQT